MAAGTRCRERGQARLRRLTFERLEERALLAGAGLTGQYFDNVDFTNLKLTRTDAMVSFDWGTGSPDSSIGADTFSVRWTGQVQAQYSELYTFYANADDGARLWVNRQLILDNWMSQSAAELSGQIPLRAGEFYDIKLEYYENTGNAAVSLWWSSPSQSKQVIPQSQLYPTTGPDDRGSIQQEIWTGISGTEISALLASPDYPAKPDAREYLTSFESLRSDWADNYGQRARGYLVPALTGSYLLAISGDDQTQLYLSTDADPAHKSLIAQSAWATNFREFTKYPSQQSAPISLVAGQKYYVEALHKEGTGSDHFSVGWQVPGASQITVIPGDVLVPFGTDTPAPPQGSFLATLAQGRPRLLSTPERFEWLKQQIAGPGQMQSWYNSIKSSADSILTEPLPQYTLDERGNLLDVSRSVVDHIYKLALVYRIGGDSQYAERAWDELSAAANFPDWHPGHFLDTAEMTHAFAIAYDWLYDYWTADRRSVISNAIVTMGLNQALPLYRGNSGWVRSTSNNWNLVCNGGMVIGALAIAEEQPSLVEEVLAYAIPSVSAVMEHFTADDGGWYEGPGYWDYSTRYNSRMLAALESALGSDFGLGRIPGVSETGNFALYDMGPTKLSFNFADAGTGSMKGPQLFWYARRYNRPLLAWFERTYGSYDPLALLWYDTRGADPLAGDTPTDAHFRGDPSAYPTQDAVTMRSAWNDSNATFVGFKPGKVGDSHGHLDAGSFVMDALGQRWVHDLGSDDYALPDYFGSKRWTYYRLRAEGHNTLVINPGSAADQSVGAVTTIIRDQSTADQAISIANLTAAYPGTTRVWRGISLDRRDGSVLVQDEIEASSPAEIWWFMHVKLDPSQVQISPDGTSAMLTSGSNRLWVKIVASPGAQLTLMDPVPLPTSPNPSGQDANTGYHKLAIHMLNVTSRQLAVWLVPLTAGQNPPSTLPTIGPLANWSCGPDGQHWLGDIDSFTRNGTSDDVYVDPAWRAQVAAATASPLAGFDVVADNQAVPFTFTFSVPAGQQVTGATLTLALRSTGGDTSTDRLYLDSISNSLLYSSLGWAALGTTPTARTLDLSHQLALLQDGQLNVAVQKNTAVDWAVLNVETAPTGRSTFTTLYPEADAYVRDGSYADQNFGTGNLATKKDSGAGYNRESYLRFDLSGITETVTAAAVRLVPVSLGGPAENQVAFVSDDAWTESGITWNNKPSSGSQFASWTPVLNLPEQFDVTSLVQNAMAGDQKLSLRVFSTVAGADYWVNYASRENASSALRPQLLVTTVTADANPILRIDGDRDTPNQDDTIRLVADHGYVSVFLNNSTELPNFRRDVGTLQQILVNGLGGNDTLSVDFSSGNPVPAAGLVYDGGDGNDTLAVAGGGSAAVTSPTQVTFRTSSITCNSNEYGSFSVAGLTVSGCTLRLGTDNAISSMTDVTVDGGGTLDLNGHSTAADLVTLANGTITGGTLVGSSYTVQSGSVSASLGGSGGLTKNTTAKVILSGANSYTGTTLIYEGILNGRNAQAFGTGNAAVTVSVSGAADRRSALELEGDDFTIADKPLNSTGSGIDGNGAVHNISGNHTWTGAVTLTGGGGGSTFQSDAGTLAFTNTIAANTTSRSLTLQGTGNGVISGSIQDGLTLGLPLTKKGSGTWTLSGANTYTGKTTVSAGTLLVNGSLAGGDVSVSSAATLGGNGTIGGSVTVNSSGNLSPATAGTAGTLSVASLTLSSGSVLNYDLAAPPSGDRTNVANTLTLSGGKINVTNLGSMQAGTYTLIDYAGTLGGSFSKLSLGTVPGGFGYQLVNNTSNTSIDLAVTNNPPTNITLSGSSVPENQPADTLVGTLWSADSDPGDTFTYTLVSGQGSTDNASFAIAGNQLKTAAIFNFEARSSYSIRIRTTDVGGLWFEKPFTVTVTNVPEVQGRRIFYNNSYFDNPANNSGFSDDTAVATDKQALLPGTTAGFANCTSYGRGINGIMVDIDALPGTPTAADFQFKASNDNTPGMWTSASQPTSVTVRKGAGTGGSDRVTLIWDDYNKNDPTHTAVANSWLQITVFANERTGLAAADAFYVGNLIGETGNVPGELVVNNGDLIKIRLAIPLPDAPISSAYDINRDGVVNNGDRIAARNNVPNSLSLTTPLASPPGFAGSSFSVTGGTVGLSNRGNGTAGQASSGTQAIGFAVSADGTAGPAGSGIQAIGLAASPESNTAGQASSGTQAIGLPDCADDGTAGQASSGTQSVGLPASPESNTGEQAARGTQAFAMFADRTKPLTIGTGNNGGGRYELDRLSAETQPIKKGRLLARAVDLVLAANAQNEGFRQGGFDSPDC